MRGGMRNPMPEQPADIRNKNFEEVALGYDMATAIDEAQRCLNCPKPRCVEGCPVNVEIPAFIQAIAQSKLNEAITILKRKNSLPAVCGRVCPQENQCESKCVLGIKGESVAIGRLERFVADYAREQGIDITKTDIDSSKDKKIAIVGSGPSGLTAAGDLAKMGYDVTMYEALHAPGGVLMYGIPQFRLPKEIVKHEIDALKDLGVKIIPNAVIGRTFTIKELMDEEVCPVCGGHHDHDHEECGCGHDHDHDHHHHHHADDVFTSWGVETAHKFTEEELTEILHKLAETKDYGDVLRAKGIVAAAEGEWFHFDLVPEETEVRRGAADFTGRICVIGADLKEDAIKELFHVA